jgi:hypothetical protein
VAAAIFAHTGTLGVRWSRMNRLTTSRTSVAVEVGPPGRSQVVTVKVADTADGLAGFGTATAELADAEAAARALGWPVRAVCEAAVAQYRAQPTAPRLHDAKGNDSFLAARRPLTPQLPRWQPDGCQQRAAGSSLPVRLNRFQATSFDLSQGRYWVGVPDGRFRDLRHADVSSRSSRRNGTDWRKYSPRMHR